MSTWLSALPPTAVWIGVLHVGDIDAVARSLIAVNGEVEVGLADHAEHAQILHAANILA